MKRLIYAILCFILVGCSVNLTKEGSNVRVVSEKERNDCTFINVVTGSMSMGVNTGHDAESAMSEARNKVAALGGNGMRILNTSTDINATTVIAEALKCNYKNP